MWPGYILPNSWRGGADPRYEMLCAAAILIFAAAIEGRGNSHALGLSLTGGAASPQLLSALRPSLKRLLDNQGRLNADFNRPLALS